MEVVFCIGPSIGGVDSKEISASKVVIASEVVIKPVNITQTFHCFYRYLNNEISPIDVTLDSHA